MSDQYPPPDDGGTPGGPPAGGPPPGGPPPGGPPGGGPPFAGPPPAGPPPAGPSGYGGPGAPEPYTIGAAFNYGWTKFTQNLGPILIGVLIYFVVIIVFLAVWGLILGAIGLVAGDTAAGFFGVLLTGALFALVAVVGGILVQAAVTRAALAVTAGRPLDLNVLLSTDNLGQIVIGAVVLSIVSSIGFALCYLPGLVVVFFTQFFVHFVIDKGLEWTDAIKASFNFVNANVGTLIGLFLASILAYMVGALLCGVGLLAALPVVIIAQAYTYRRLQGQPVAA